MELVKGKDLKNFKSKEIAGVYGDLIDIEKLGVSFDGITYDDNWTVRKFLKYFKNKKRIFSIFKYLGIESNILNKKIFELTNFEFKWMLLAYMMLINAKIMIFDYFDVGLIYKDKKKLVSIINQLSKDGIEIMVITNDLVFLNRLNPILSVIKEGDVVYRGSIVGALQQGLIPEPPIAKFINEANKKGAHLNMELDSNELLKNIYRSVI